MLFRLAIVFLFLFISNLSADYKEGKKIFEKRCSTCHGNYISISDLKTNFFEKKAPLADIFSLPCKENLLAHSSVCGLIGLF